MNPAALLEWTRQLVAGTTRPAAIAAITASLVGCIPPPVEPMDTSAVPTATTSAEPLFIETGRTDDAAVPDPVPPPSALKGDLPEGWAGLSVVSENKGVPPPVSAVIPEQAKTTPVSVWQEHLGDKGKVDFPRSKAIGMVGVVIRGVATMKPSEGGTLAALPAWGAFSAPGLGVSLDAGEGGADVILVAYALNGTLQADLQALRKNFKMVYWDKRPGPIAVVELARQPEWVWAKGEARARGAFSTDQSSHVYLGTMMLGKDLPVARHSHADSWEILLPIQAHGKLTIAGDKATDVDVNPGQVIAIPPGLEHSWTPSGEPLVAIQLFTPRGPEARYKELSSKTQ